MGQAISCFKVVYWGYHDRKPNITQVPIHGEHYRFDQSSDIINFYVSYDWDVDITVI